MPAQPETLLGFADIVILTLVVLLMLHMLVQEKSKGLATSFGRSILLAGIFLAAFANFAELFAPIPVTGSGTVAGAGNLAPEWMFWVATRTSLLMIAIGLYLSFLQRMRIERQAVVTAAKVRAAEDQAILSEQRFRSLFETTTSSVYCYTLDPPMPVSLPLDEQIEASRRAILAECNDVFARVLEHERAPDVIGTRMSLLDSTHDDPSHRAFWQAFIDSGFRLADYELVYKGPGGDDRAVSLNVTGIVENDRLVRFWGIERNIIDVRRTKSALSRRQEFQELLASVSTRLLTTSYEDASRAMQQSLRDVCEFVGGNRISLSWLDTDKESAEVLYTWHDGHSRMFNAISERQFPYLAEKLLAGETMTIKSVSELPEEAARDREALLEVGMKSFLFFPLIVAGDIIGVLTMGNDREFRDWGRQDALDIQVFGELFANFVLRMRQRQALDVALDGLQQATDRLEAENVYLRTEIKLTHDFEEIIGDSEPLRRSLKMIEQVADTMTPVLILGETGTGKELVARALHEHSSRRHRPLVKVNCAALPASLIESELFGYEKGAFTGADSAKRGRFDLAHGSTLFLDEIGEIPYELQAKLLRVLQEGEFERLGGSKTVRVDVRIVAATNRDLWKACENGEFRTDLYYRINTFPIELPALRDRGNDVCLLAEHFANVHAQRLGREVTAISARMMRQLQAYDWPGNVRELEGVIQRALISSSGPVLDLGHSLAGRAGDDFSDSGLYDLRAVEREHITTTLEECRWKISGQRGAAAALGVPPSTLRSKMKKLGIERPA
ncbi:MAG: sigma 54-interacting transcriptional regulator [Woeseiaceae bacterium]|nr:sigma 54-interacting transcriptional regulator [Woeseiaceae bacterium]